MPQSARHERRAGCLTKSELRTFCLEPVPDTAQVTYAPARFLSVFCKWVARATRPLQSATRRAELRGGRLGKGRPHGLAALSHFVRRVAGRHRRVAYATPKRSRFYRVRAQSSKQYSDECDANCGSRSANRFVRAKGGCRPYWQTRLSASRSHILVKQHVELQP